MRQVKYRKYIIILFTIGIFFILAAIFNIWNVYVTDMEQSSFLPILYLIISLISFTILLKISFNATNIDYINNVINEKVTEKLNVRFNEIEKKQEVVVEEDSGDTDIEETINKLIPSRSYKKLDTFGKNLLSNFASTFNLVQGIIYLYDAQSKKYTFTAGYALTNEESIKGFELGENLNGEVAKNQETMIITDIPENYFNVISGLGDSKPTCLVIYPVVSGKKTIAVLELALFKPLDEKLKKILEQSGNAISSKLKKLTKL